MRRIGASIADNTTPAIGRCISYDRQNTSQTTHAAITSMIETITSTIETMIMATVMITTTTTIGTTTISEERSQRRGSSFGWTTTPTPSREGVGLVTPGVVHSRLV